MNGAPIKVTRTVRVPIKLDAAQIQIMDSVIDSFSRMFESVVRWCKENQSVNRTRLQKHLYHQLRAQEPDSLAQFASIALRVGAGAMKSWNSNNRKKKWKLNPQRKSRSVPLDKKLFSIRGNLVTISTTKGASRIRTTVNVPSWFSQRYPGYQYQAATLHISRKGNVYLNLICQTETKPASKNRTQTVGIDRGLYKIAVTSKGGEYSGAELRKVRRKYQHNRATLQRKGTRSAKRRLKANSGREKRFTLNSNHIISKKLASDPKIATYVLEDLTGIRKVKKKYSGKWLGQWAFRQLEFFLRYKCQAQGIEIVCVDPKYTSQTCNACGYCVKKNRHKGQFLCRRCHMRDNADVNAAKNIRDKYFLSMQEHRAGRNQPPVMDGSLDKNLQLRIIKTNDHVQTPPLVGVGS